MKWWLLICSMISVVAIYAFNQSSPTHYSLSPYQANSFEQYVAETSEWLRSNRQFVSNNHQFEIEANSPFELRPQGAPKGAILLVHGLGDSPYTFRDIASNLVEEGFLVRTILLPGHGSKPSDMLQVSAKDWFSVVTHHTKLLTKQYHNVWLGGFSTGANLVTRQALLDDKVQGLLLFSPAFKPHSPFARFSSLVSPIKTWAVYEDEVNPLRYTSQSFHGGGEYYKTSVAVRELLAQRSYLKPTLMVITESDRVIDTEYAKSQFATRFLHPDSQLIWYGETDIKLPKSQQFSMRSAQLNISTGSHMSALFSPDNDHYGISGDIRLCRNGQDRAATQLCKDKNQEVWYSAFGHIEEGKIHARLTFNPYYSALMSTIQGVLAIER